MRVARRRKEEDFERRIGKSEEKLARVGARVVAKGERVLGVRTVRR